MLDRKIVETLIWALLDRPPVAEHIEFWMRMPSIDSLISEIVKLEEYVVKTKNKLLSSTPDATFIDARSYFRPMDLSDIRERKERVFLIGSCFVSPWSVSLVRSHPDCVVDHFLAANAFVVPERPATEIGQYAFQVVHITPRTIFPDHDICLLMSGGPEVAETLLRKAKQRLDIYLQGTLTHYRQHGLETFVLNLIVPQFNTFGRLASRQRDRSFRYLVEAVNRYLAECLDGLSGCYLIDVDALAASFGKRYILDDSVTMANHGSWLADFATERDARRLEVPEPISQQYEIRAWQFIDILWDELFAAHDTIAQHNSVKLVVTDLDDTLWRGVIGEDETDPESLEGWPLGYVEALLALKQRGVLLGIISKNTEAVVREKWANLVGSRIGIADFAVVRINWEPKVQNMGAILADVNLTSRSVVYVDDNPVERAAIRSAFPGIRVLGANPYTLKRTLILSPETQVSTVTSEARMRTEMIQAQTRRNADMHTMSRQQFLASLDLKLSLFEIRGHDDPRFSRVFELLNKTNQFNTTGKRWTSTELVEFFRGGGYIVAFDVTDIYTRYGLVGELLILGDEILQFVMSCRVIGLEIETTAVNLVAKQVLAGGYQTVRSSVVETSANSVCRDVFKRAGFTNVAGTWRLSNTEAIQLPDHLHITYEASTVPALSL